MQRGKSVVVVGAGSIAEMAHEYLWRQVIAFTIDGKHITDDQFKGLPIVPFADMISLYPPGQHDVFVAVGDNDLRARFFAEAKGMGYDLISYISPHAFVWDNVRVGENCFIMENNVIQPFVTIGDDVIMWSGNHLGHHTSIGDHTFVASHVVIAGYVKIGRYCFLGINATIRDGIMVADRCVIGAGALIMRDTAAGEVYSVRRTYPRAET